MSARVADVVVAGGGQVGLALAAVLKQALPGFRIVVVDAADPRAANRPARASTIAAGGRKLLQTLGVWDAVAGEAEPVLSMVVTDSRTQDLVRPVFLTFDPAAGGDEPGAHVVADALVVDALGARALALGVEIIPATRIVAHDLDGGVIACRTHDGKRLDARLLVAADGARSKLRALAGISTIGHRYGQSGIVATLAHERPHGGRADEHFLPGGPFALLPMKGNRSSLVWTERTADAERMMRTHPEERIAELMARAGRRLGAIEIVEGPHAFPLQVLVARRFTAERLALAGDAAHVIHPLAGQGLNLGYRDVAALAETVVDAARLGLDFGDTGTLAAYERWRRFDTLEMATMMEVLNRLFANDNPALRIVRDVGLGIVDRLPRAREFLAAEARGDGAGAPRLLRGDVL